MIPSIPADDDRRRDSLHPFQRLDTTPDPALDELSALAAQVCAAPMAFVSIIDERRQRLVSTVGLAPGDLPRDGAFCQHTIQQRDVFSVGDAAGDPRFASEPLVVGEAQARAYAGAPLVTAEGAVLGTLGVLDRAPRQIESAQLQALRVLSRQVTAQLELRHERRERFECERRFLALFRGCPIALAIHRFSDRTFVDVNPAFTMLLGWTAEELAGRTITDVGILDVDRVAPLRSTLQTTGLLRDAEIDVRTRTGERRHVLMGAEVVELRGESHAVTTFVDITARRVAEEARQRSEERYRALFEYGPDGILIADRDSYYLDANVTMCRMLGYTREELIGFHASDIVTPAEAAHVAPALAVIHARHDYQREWQFRRKDGTVFPAEVTATTMPDGNLLGQVRDITERKKLERQFLRAQRMESIGTLAGGIAHDLNNVLTPVLMSIEVLKGLTRNDEDLALVTMLQSSTERGADLVRQVLSFARGVEGQRILVSPIHVLGDLITVIRETFPKSIDVQMSAAPDLWTVTGDPTQIHQVFLNLCVNARDAMPDGGVLTIRMENAVLDETYASMNVDAMAGAYVVVSVADTGCGIPPGIRDRVFEPFFTTREVGSGTGLGLSTALAIVKSHGGFIHLYSEVRNGTRFKVYLPANTSEVAVDPAVVRQTRLARGRGELVLVVDDEEAIRRIVQGTLERFGYRVLLAANGAEAVALYAQHRSEIAVVVTDMAMPVMDGPATIIALKALNPSVKIIGSSGLASNGGVAQAVGAGVQHFVPKPYTADTMLTTLRQIIDGG